MPRRNKYSKMRSERQQDQARAKGQPTTAEVEASAAEAVSVMQTADEVTETEAEVVEAEAEAIEPEPEASEAEESESESTEAGAEEPTEAEIVEAEAEESEPEPTEAEEPNPESKPQTTRPAQDPAPEPMVGIVTEVSQPAKPVLKPKYPQPPAPLEEVDLGDSGQLRDYADRLEARGELASQEDYERDEEAELVKRLHCDRATQKRLNDAKAARAAEEAQYEAQLEAYEAYLAEFEIQLVVRKHDGTDVWYDVALANYLELDVGDEEDFARSKRIRALLYHPDSKEIMEFESPTEQRQAKEKFLAQRKADARKAQAKKGGQKGRRNNSGGNSRH